MRPKNDATVCVWQTVASVTRSSAKTSRFVHRVKDHGAIVPVRAPKRNDVSSA
jgi:hypothetical protein